MKEPKTIDGKINRIQRTVNAQGYSIRKFWYCNAGWGMSFVPCGSTNTSDQFVYTYYNTIESCVKGNYKKMVTDKFQIRRR